MTKEVDWASVEADGTLEEPYAASGNWADGTEMTDTELEALDVSMLYDILFNKEVCRAEAYFEGDR